VSRGCGREGGGASRGCGREGGGASRSCRREGGGASRGCGREGGGASRGGASRGGASLCGGWYGGWVLDVRQRHNLQMGSSAQGAKVCSSCWMKAHYAKRCVDDLPPLDAEFASLDDF